MTFSLIGRDQKTGAIGLAVSTSSVAVGKRVPHFQTSVGLVATQGKTHILYGTIGLRLMKLGFSAKEAMDILIRKDQNREYRQVLITSLSGDWAVHTGKKSGLWNGHLIRPECVAMGNTLYGREVIESMVDGFEGTYGSLASRLMSGLKMGDDAGGDRKGKRSAALLVLSPHQFKRWGPQIDLRVDFDSDPVGKLIEILDAYLVWEEKTLNEMGGRVYDFDADD